MMPSLNMNHVQAIRTHLNAIRIELSEPITPRRKLPSVTERIGKRLDKIEALLRLAESITKAERQAACDYGEALKKINRKTQELQTKPKRELGKLARDPGPGLKRCQMHNIIHTEETFCELCVLERVIPDDELPPGVREWRDRH